MSEKFEKSEIARNLIKIRKDNGFTQSNVAEYLKIKRSTYAYYERNVYPPQDIIKKLSQLYNIGMHELLYGKPDPVEVNRIKLSSAEINNDSILSFKNEHDFFGPNAFDGTNLSTLTVKERKLVAMFRLLPAQYRDRILRELEELTDKLDWPNRFLQQRLWLGAPQLFCEDLILKLNY